MPDPTPAQVLDAVQATLGRLHFTLPLGIGVGVAPHHATDRYITRRDGTCLWDERGNLDNEEEAQALCAVANVAPVLAGQLQETLWRLAKAERRLRVVAAGVQPEEGEGGRWDITWFSSDERLYAALSEDTPDGLRARNPDGWPSMEAALDAVADCLEERGVLLKDWRETNPGKWAVEHPGDHLWCTFHGHVVCACCGVVRRADGKNKPCRGVVKVALREEDHAH